MLALLLAALAVGGALVALGLFPQEPLRRLVEERLQQNFGPASRLGTLDVVPGRLRAEVGGLVLEAPAFRLEIDRATVALHPRTLWSRELWLRTFVLDGGLAAWQRAGGPTHEHL